MKVKYKQISYEKLQTLPKKKYKKPKKINGFFRLLLKIICHGELKKVKFKLNKIGMEKLGKKQPCLVLMNHCSSIDLKIAATMMGKRPISIICTIDAMLGKEWIMRKIGCIPTDKFVKDTQLIRDMLYALNHLKSTVIMFPEAGYSIDGKASLLPDSVGKLVKLLNVPVVMVTTYGAFTYDPLHNNLQRRNVQVTADIKYLLSPEDTQEKTYQELNQIIFKEFDFDYFKWQKENNVIVNEPFRADGLNRVLYKCPACMQEGKMVGNGTTLKCEVCGKEYLLTELGEMQAITGDTEFSHIPDWSEWQREKVREEILSGNYHMQVPVNIGVIVNTKAIYMVGEGTLTHDKKGFNLVGCDGKINYFHDAMSTHSVVADFFFYEREDVVCVGDRKILYFCFPVDQSKDVVYKMRLAHEELYKMYKGGELNKN